MIDRMGMLIYTSHGWPAFSSVCCLMACRRLVSVKLEIPGFLCGTT